MKCSWFWKESFLPSLPESEKSKCRHDDIFGKPRGWVYATDSLLDHYRCRAGDVDEKTAREFRKILRWTIARHAIHPGSRFTDKSQLYTVKVGLLQEILKDYDPKFVLVVRDPFVSCYRAAKKHLLLPELGKILDFEEMLSLASQHWANSIQAALDDGRSMTNFSTIRFEDLLLSPESTVRKICDFVELDFSEEMLPRAGDQMPFGSLRRNRWYPLRSDVNQRYFDQMKPEHAEIIAERCGDLATYFEYDYPFN